MRNARNDKLRRYNALTERQRHDIGQRLIGYVSAAADTIEAHYLGELIEKAERGEL